MMTSCSQLSDRRCRGLSMLVAMLLPFNITRTDHAPIQALRNLQWRRARLVKSCLSEYRGKKLVTVATATAVGAPTLHRFGYPRNYFFTPRTASFAALATRNLTTVLAGILIFCCVFGLKPVRAFLFCFSSLPKPGKTNSPFFLVAL